LAAGLRPDPLGAFNVSHNYKADLREEFGPWELGIEMEMK